MMETGDRFLLLQEDPNGSTDEITIYIKGFLSRGETENIHISIDSDTQRQKENILIDSKDGSTLTKNFNSQEDGLQTLWDTAGNQELFFPLALFLSLLQPPSVLDGESFPTSVFSLLPFVSFRRPNL